MVADPALGLAAPDLYLVTILLLASAIVEFALKTAPVRRTCAHHPAHRRQGQRRRPVDNGNELRRVEKPQIGRVSCVRQASTDWRKPR